MIVANFRFSKVLIPFLITTIIFHFSYGLSILLPTNINWLMNIHHDWGTHYLGWAFFKEEPWSFPIGNIEKYNFPIGTNVGFTDSIPLLAILFKPFSFLMPDDFQYFGIWLFFCMFMMGFYTLKILELYKVNLWISLLAVILISASPVLIFRSMHPGLYAHFLIVASIYHYLKTNYGNSKKILIYQTIIFVLAGSINPYLAFMIFGFNIIIPVKMYFIDKKIAFSQVLIYPFLGIVLLLLLWFLIGLIGFNMGSNLASVEKYSQFSFNLNSFFNGYGEYSKVFPNLGWTNPSQYEGFAYLGIGLMLLLLIGLLYFFKAVIKENKTRFFLKQYGLLILITLLYFAFAISNEISLGTKTYFVLPQPKFIETLGSIFRASGRFVWPFYYLIFIFSLLAFAKLKWNKSVQIFVLLAITCLQFFDVQKLFSQWNLPSGTYETPLSDANWKHIFSHFDQIIVHPPFSYQYTMTYPMDYQDYCYLALKAKKPISNAYVGRTNVDKTNDFKNSFLISLNKGKFIENQLIITTFEHIHVFQYLYKKGLIEIKILDEFLFIYSKNVKINDNLFDQDVENNQKLKALKTQFDASKITNLEKVNKTWEDNVGILYSFDIFESDSETLRLRGWSFLENIIDNKGHSVFLVLSDENQNHFKIPLQKEQRPDVTNAFKKTFLDDAGFNDVIDVSKLPKKNYEIGILILDTNQKENYRKTEKKFRN